MQRSAIVLMLMFLALGSPAFCKDIVLLQPVGTDPEAIDAARDYTAGAQVFLDALNAHGGIRGRKVTILAKPVADVPSAGALMSVAEADDAIVALFATVGEQAMHSIGATQQFRTGQIAMFAPLTGNDDLPKLPVFYVRASYRDEVDRVVDWFGANGVSTMAVVRVAGMDDEVATIRNRVNAAHVRLVADQVLGVNYPATAQAVVASQAQVVVVLGDAIATGNFIKALRPRAPGTFIVALSNVSQDTLLQLAGPQLAAGTILMQVMPGPKATQLALVREHLAAMKQYRDEPASNLTVEGYLAAKVIAEVMRSITGPIDRASVLKALRISREYDAGGFVLQLGSPATRASKYADLTMLRGDGTLLQ
jgi:ABC-type branched-subunit amino acid transport system substrate-binding protein